MMRYSPFRHIDSVFSKRRPIQLTCFLTRRCDAHCPYCFYLNDTKQKKDPAGELTVDELRHVAKSLGSLLWLAFSGGEIFLRDDLADIVASFYNENRPAIILLPTNGLNTQAIIGQTEAILERCPKSTIVVKLSLDGPPQVHDATRRLKGAFAKTIRTCEALGSLLERYDHLELGVNSVYSAANHQYLLDFLQDVQGWPQVKTHTVSLVRGRTWHDRPAELDELLAGYEGVVADMERRLKNRVAAIYRFRGGRLKAAQDSLQRRYILQTASGGKRLSPCYAGRLNLVLTEYGDIYPCESFEEPMRLGNIREYGFDLTELMRSVKAKQVLAGISQKRCCCTHECYMMTNILFNPRVYPHLLKEYLQLSGHLPWKNG